MSSTRRTVTTPAPELLNVPRPSQQERLIPTLDEVRRAQRRKSEGKRKDLRQTTLLKNLLNEVQLQLNFSIHRRDLLLFHCIEY